MGWLRERGFSGNGPHADDFRELAERHVPSGEPLYYCVTSREGAFSPTGRWMPCLLAAVGPALAWHLFAHSQGAVFYDYAPLWRPGFARFAEALRRILAAAFLRPWKFGFAYPAALLILASMLGRRRSAAWRVEREALVMAGVALACIPAFALVYSYSMAPDFEWHIRTSVDRLLWCPATMLTVFGFRRQCRCNSHVEGAERIMPGTDSATARNAMQRELDVYCD